MLTLNTCYLLLFLLLIPLERRLFCKLVPVQRFFQYRHLGLYIALMPLVVLFAYALPMLDSQLYHSMPERIGRLALPIFFFLIFRLVITTAHHMSEHTAEVNRNNLLAQQLYSLREYTRLTEEKRQTLRVLRHDMRHIVCFGDGIQLRKQLGSEPCLIFLGQLRTAYHVADQRKHRACHLFVHVLLRSTDQTSAQIVRIFLVGQMLSFHYIYYTLYYMFLQ
jgi:hypothetical protein